MDIMAAIAYILHCNFYVVFYCCFTLDSMKLTGDDGDVLFDFSKNIVSDKTMNLLFSLVSKLKHTHPCLHSLSVC